MPNAAMYRDVSDRTSRLAFCFHCLQGPYFITDERGRLKIKLAHRFSHLFFLLRNERPSVHPRRKIERQQFIDRFLMFRTYLVGYVAYRLSYGLRRNAVRLVVRDLNRPSAFRLIDRFFKRTGHLVGIKQYASCNIARGPTDGLDKRNLRTQKTLLVGIKYRHQFNFGKVEPFTQKVDADEAVESSPCGALTKISKYLNARYRFYIAVQIFRCDLSVFEILREVLRHLFGERRDHDTAAVFDDFFRLGEKIPYLTWIGPFFRNTAYVNHRIDQSGRTDDLFDDLRALFPFER